MAGKSQLRKNNRSVELMDKGCIGGCGRVLGVTLEDCMGINRLLKAQSYQQARLQS